MNYQNAVAEGRRLAKRSQDDSWRLAELTYHVVQDGKSRSQWARDIGVSVMSTSRWYRVWEEYGDVTIVKRPDFGEAVVALSENDPEPEGAIARRDERRALNQVVAMVKESPHRFALAIAQDPDAVHGLYEALSHAAPRESVPHERPSFDDRCADAVNKLNTALVTLARLKEESERDGLKLGGHAVIALSLYEVIAERQLDAEIRSILAEAK